MPLFEIGVSVVRTAAAHLKSIEEASGAAMLY